MITFVIAEYEVLCYIVTCSVVYTVDYQCVWYITVCKYGIHYAIYSISVLLSHSCIV